MSQLGSLDALLEALRQAEGAAKNPKDTASPTSNSGSGHIPTSADFFKHQKPLTKKMLLSALVILIVVALVSYWWFHPAISLYSVDFWMFVSFVILTPLLALFFMRSVSYEHGVGVPSKDAKRALFFKRLCLIPLAIMAIGIVGAIASLSIIPGNAERYAHILETEKLNFEDDIKEVDYTQIPIIDRDSAALLGNRTMGAIPEYVSQFEISPIYTQINFQKRPVRVSPLVYADLYKWFTNRSQGIPAYIKVDMANQDTQVVRLSEGIKYSDSEPLFRNVDRHVQLSHPFYLFGEKAFEIDDEGHPWWIFPVEKRTIGLFGGTTIDRVVLCDAVTGKTQDYAIKDCPQWVDRAYPTQLLVDQYNWSGKYQNGWLNSWLGQQGVVQTTPGLNGTQGWNYIAKDDDVWVYTGVTSATADNSIVGFVLINQRTAESHFYSVAGATESSAMSSAEGQVQNLRYHASFPLLINVNAQPTYFMALKDDAGLVKQFAMIDIQRYQNVAVGDTVASCQKNYKQLLAKSGDAQETASENLLQVSGKIRSLSQATLEGNTHFYVVLDGHSEIFDCPLPGLLPIVKYLPGDEISFKYTQDSPACTVFEIVGATSSQDLKEDKSAAAVS